MADVEFIDNSAEVLRALQENIETALEAVGQQAVSHAKQTIEKGVPRHGGSWYTSQGGAGLRGSIEHKVVMSEKAVHVGTNNDHAAYNEFGTGAFAEGGGRQGWWVYVPGGGKSGTNTGKVYSFEEAKRILAMLRADGLDAHMTNGIKPLHFLKDAALNHTAEYRATIKMCLEGK